MRRSWTSPGLLARRPARSAPGAPAGRRGTQAPRGSAAPGGWAYHGRQATWSGRRLAPGGSRAGRDRCDLGAEQRPGRAGLLLVSRLLNRFGKLGPARDKEQDL